MAKKRIDVLMVERGLCPSRAVAQRLVMAGEVRVNGQLVLKASSTVPSNAAIEIEQPPPYVSRGGEKLAAALESFQISVQGKICADIGASTGGFTDCLLQHGAQRVYAIDVGKGILHWKIRQNTRVIVMEETNARHVEILPEAVDLITVDASFISLKILLPVLKAWYNPEIKAEATGRQNETPTQMLETQAGENPKTLIALIKPQFEAGRSEVARGDGVIRDTAIHRRVLQEILEFARSESFAIQGLMRSPLMGPKGNVEFLAWMEYPGQDHVSPIEIDLELLTNPETTT
jgi:23S rRNA (cytidine1920-2'-O)/16S rRNA (cytidine1409-2'-O)-methyltransferase